MSAVERDDFDQLDRCIRRHVQGFVQLGLSLREVQQRRLYREQYRTFEKYLDDIGLQRQRAYELIEAAIVAAGVSEISDITISKESHAAALADVPAEKRPAVLKIAATGGKITAKSIKRAAGIFGEIDFDAEPENPRVCAKATDGIHVWDDDADGRFCSACKCDYIDKFHGQPRWAAAAGQIMAGLQARGTAEARLLAEQMIRRLAALLDDLEAGRISIDDLRKVRAEGGR